MSRMTGHRATVAYAAALIGPAILTGLLSLLTTVQSRDYVFLYLAIVAVLGSTAGVKPATAAAALSFLLVDFFFVPPLHTFTIADETDLVNLAVFFGAAGVVGGLGSRRRAAQLRAERLARELTGANRELTRLSREQAEAAAVAVRLAQTQQQVRVLEATDQMRRELLGNISHELRTPLSTILTGTTALADRPDLPGPDRDDLAVIAQEARRLDHLVADMLDMARIEGEALDLTLDDVDLVDAIETAVRRLAGRHPGRKVAIRCERPLAVVADWLRLGQVLDNLLNNADRFAPPGTELTVTAEVGRRHTAVVRIHDDGPGVDPEIRKHIFERFVTGAAGQGTGLGLAIARGLVEAHAGHIWLDDEVPNGTTICFTIPLSKESTNPVAPPAGEGSQVPDGSAGPPESQTDGGDAPASSSPL